MHQLQGLLIYPNKKGSVSFLLQAAQTILALLVALVAQHITQTILVAALVVVGLVNCNFFLSYCFFCLSLTALIKKLNYGLS